MSKTTDKKLDTKALTIAERIKAIKAECDAQITKEIEAASGEFSRTVEQLETIFDGLPDEVRENLSPSESLTTLNRLVSKMSKKRKVRQSTGKRGPNAPKVSDDEILKFLATERTSKDVEDGLKLSINTGKRLNALLGAKKVTVRKDGTTKHWKAV